MDPLDAVDPADPDDDLERLARLLFSMAVQLLQRRGRFFPFGAVVWADDGEVQLAAAPAESADANDPTGLLDALVEQLKADADEGRVRAVGTCVDVVDDEEVGRAIRIDVESADGDARTALLRYERRWPRRFTIDPRPVERPGPRRAF